MNKSLVALFVGAFVLGSGALLAQGVPQSGPEETARLKAEHDAAEKAESKMTPEQKAAAKKAKHKSKQKQLSQVEKVGNPNAQAKAEAVAKSHQATKSHPKPLPDDESRQKALEEQTKNPPGH